MERQLSDHDRKHLHTKLCSRVRPTYQRINIHHRPISSGHRTCSNYYLQICCALFFSYLKSFSILSTRKLYRFFLFNERQKSKSKLDRKMGRDQLYETGRTEIDCGSCQFYLSVLSYLQFQLRIQQGNRKLSSLLRVALDATLPELNKTYSDCAPFCVAPLLDFLEVVLFLIFLQFQNVTADRSITLEQGLPWRPSLLLKRKSIRHTKMGVRTEQRACASCPFITIQIRDRSDRNRLRQLSVLFVSSSLFAISTTHTTRKQEAFSFLRVALDATLPELN